MPGRPNQKYWIKLCFNGLTSQKLIGDPRVSWRHRLERERQGESCQEVRGELIMESLHLVGKYLNPQNNQDK